MASWYIDIIKWVVILSIIVIAAKQVYDRFIKKSGGKNKKWEDLLEG